MNPASSSIDRPVGGCHLLEAEAAPPVRARRIEEEAPVEGVFVPADAMAIEGLDAREVLPAAPEVCVLSVTLGVSGVMASIRRPVRLRYGQTPGSARRH
jgi:hypothetical protein